MWSATVQAAVIAVLVVLEVAVWQVRVALATRGRKRSAAGVYVGVVADGRFAGDPVEYRASLPGEGTGPADGLAARGWPVTVQPALGPGGPATVLVVVDSARTAEIERDLDLLAPGAFCSSIRLRSATRSPSSPARSLTAAARLLRPARDLGVDPAPAGR